MKTLVETYIPFYLTKDQVELLERAIQEKMNIHTKITDGYTRLGMIFGVPLMITYKEDSQSE